MEIHYKCDWQGGELSHLLVGGGGDPNFTEGRGPQGEFWPFSSYLLLWFARIWGQGHQC